MGKRGWVRRLLPQTLHRSRCVVLQRPRLSRGLPFSHQRSFQRAHSRRAARQPDTTGAHRAYSINNITGKKNADGSMTIQFGGCDGKIPNCLPMMEGWNYTVRLYRPRAEILSGMEVPGGATGELRQ